MYSYLGPQVTQMNLLPGDEQILFFVTAARKDETETLRQAVEFTKEIYLSASAHWR